MKASPRHRLRVFFAVAIAAGFADAIPAAAKERLVRQLGRDLGTPPQWVSKIVQDPTGYLWLATVAGLYRYDGVELRRWAPETITESVVPLVVAPDGTVYAAASEGQVYRVTATGAEPVPGPFAGHWRGTRRIDVDTRGRLWVVVYPDSPAVGLLFRQRDGGRWEEPLATLPRPERVRVVERDGDGVLVGTFEGLWRFDGNDRLERLVEFEPGIRQPVDLLRAPDGSLVFATDGSESPMTSSVFEYRDGRLTRLARVPGRGQAIAVRGETLWILSDQALTARHPDGSTEVLASAGAFHQSGLTLLVDREGSLWVGGSRGAFQYPEPDTVAWTAADGLSRGNLRLARTRDGVWVSHWGGDLGLVRRTAQGLRAGTAELKASLRLCVGLAGTLWTEAYPKGTVEHWRAQGWIASKRPDEPFRFHAPVDGLACTRSSDGGVWLSSTEGLHFVSPSDELVHVGKAHDGQRPLVGARLFDDASGGLWMIVGQDDGSFGEPALCRASVAEVRGGRNPAWRCQTLGDVKVVETGVAMPSGAVWLGTRQSGVLRYDGSRLETLPGSRDLPSPNVRVLEPARDGGFWISGVEYLWRVKERTDLPEGWSVEERLGPATGIMSDGASDVVEDDDGTLWLTTAAGLVQVPASARAPRSDEPRPRLLRVAVNGRPADPSRLIDVPYGSNQLSLDVSALLFRDPSAPLFRVRLGPGSPWSSPSRAARIQLVDVPPGRYAVEVAASASGSVWTEPSALFAFAVPTPWHRRPAVWVLGAVALLALMLSAQRARMAVRLRLERQRTQIALDLHDEMGSGLGSIRVLAGMAAHGTMAPEKQRIAAARIEGTARDLGQALTGIVWSLRDRGRTLRDLCAHVAERGHELFPDEGDATFHTAFPSEWPPEALPLPTRRNLQLILMEALHNASKHARADCVVFGAACQDGRWRLWVEDDGMGIAAAPKSRGGGHGLPGMAERASAIDADLDVGRPRGGLAGTRIEVVLPASPLNRSWPVVLRAAREAWRTSRS